MTTVHQFVQSFVDHDAASTHVRHLGQILAEMGIRSKVYAGEWRGERSKATSFADYTSTGDTDDTWLLFHFSIDTPIAAFLAERPEHVAINYHNVTPAEMIRPWEPTIASELDIAHAQFLELAGHCDYAIGVSEFNAVELRSAGYAPTTVAPVLFDPHDFERELDAKVDARLHHMKENGGADWLFVGRVAPHKCLHDVIKAFSLYQRVYDERARLHLVGGVWSHRYWTVLHQYVDALGLLDSIDITNSVSNGALGAYYKNADVFVYLSEHEGFGVPVLEAFHNDVPVVAFDAAAVGETVGGGGVLLDEKSPATVAAAVDRVLSDDDLRSQLIASGRARLAEFSLEKSTERWRKVIEQMILTGESNR